MKLAFKIISLLMWAWLLFASISFWIGIGVVVALIAGAMIGYVKVFGSTVFIKTKLQNLWGAEATTIAPYLVIIDSDGLIKKSTIVNERIHAEGQYPELLWIGFYAVYAYQALKLPYRDRPLEVESDISKMNLDYLKTRKLYAWSKL